MPQDELVVRGAREHNLKDVTVRMPRDRLTVITGLSGSGKSSLAFDTIYAEGQRRYVESLSAYARQFLGQMEKPDVDQIDGLSPAISIDQKGASRNPRSTVGTVTEVYDHLRLLFARIGHPHCPNGHEITRMTVSQIVDRILACTGADPALKQFVRDRPGHDFRYAVDDRKVRALGWEPRWTLEEGLAQTARWYAEHRDWWRRIKSGEFAAYYRNQYALDEPPAGPASGAGR